MCLWAVTNIWWFCYWQNTICVIFSHLVKLLMFYRKHNLKKKSLEKKIKSGDQNFQAGINEIIIQKGFKF